jgi:hypothetical protein
MIGVIFWKHVGFRRLYKTPVSRNDAHAEHSHGDLVEDTLDKAFEQGEGFLLWFELREEAGS